MAKQDVGRSTQASKPRRSATATVSDVGLVLIGLALLASAFSNIPVQVSGLVSVGLSAPGALLVRVVFGMVGLALLFLGLARLFDLVRHAAETRTWWKRRREPPPRREPAVNVGLPPLPNPLFRGRERELQELARRLVAERRVDLSGLGGTGKTTLAVEYLHRHSAHYPDGVFWLRGQDDTTLLGDFADLAWLERLNLSERTDHDLERVARAVTKWLLAHSRWLLVVDDLDVDQIPTLDKLLARGLQGHIVVTCRVPVSKQPLEVGPLAPEVAADYLLNAPIRATGTRRRYWQVSSSTCRWRSSRRRPTCATPAAPSLPTPNWLGPGWLSSWAKVSHATIRTQSPPPGHSPLVESSWSRHRPPPCCGSAPAWLLMPSP
jgi:hypothetical protein